MLYTLTMTRTPTRTPSPRQEERSAAVAAAQAAGALVGLMWLQEIIDQLLPLNLDRFGILPRSGATFWHILVAPFLHAGWGHLIANTVPLAVLAFMAAVRSVRNFIEATLIIMVVAGTLVWLFGRGGSVHLGASILIFGYFAYLLGAGWWGRSAGSIITAFIAVALYGGIIWGVLPTDPRISFEGHLFGFVGGLVAAALLYRRR